MLSNILDRISFLALFLIIVFLPIFFLPFTRMPVEVAKGLLLVVGLSVSIIFWAAARFFDGKIRLPKSWLLLSGLAVVLVFFVSAFFSSAPQVSFFGTMFDVGTFWFIFAGFFLMFICSIVFRNPLSAKNVLFGTIIFSAILLVFQSFRFFMPEFLSLGVLADKTDNVLGSWNAFGLYAGFYVLLSLLAIEFFTVSKFRRWLLGIMLGLSIVLSAAVNFSLVWILLGVFSLIIFVYKVSLFSVPNQADGTRTSFPVFSLIVFTVALLFFLSGVFIGGYIPNKLGLVNNEVRPTFQTTIAVTSSGLRQNPILGIGPNRFGELWANYKPRAINATPFWNISFNSGSGLLPTLLSTTGYLSILAWLFFFVLFMKIGVESIFSRLKNSVSVANQEAVAFFIASLYLFVASFLYSTGPVIFLLALAFSGIFIGVSKFHQGDEEISISFLNDPRKSFSFILFLVFVTIVSAVASFKYIERLVSVPYFSKTLSAQTTSAAEASITKALSLYTNDLYLRTYAEVYLAKLNEIAGKGASLSDADKALLQASFDQAVSGAVSATRYDGGNYFNFEMLGSVYNTAGLIGVTGAYDKAIEAYKIASTLNPLNPRLKLAMARVSFTQSKLEEAKNYGNEALALKQDYIDALIVLSQIARSEGNHTSALSYGQAALSIAPSNQDLINYVNTLKNGSSTTVPDDSKNNPKEKKN